MYKLGVIGAGVMATAIIERIVSANVLSKDEIITSDISDSRRDYFNKNGIKSVIDVSEVIKNSQTVLFAVKPQNYREILKIFSNLFKKNQTVMSIMAGVKISTLTSLLPTKKIVRIMPNMPCVLGEGAIAVAFNEITDKEYFLNLLSPLGTVIETKEDHFDAVTSVSGSGPAYVYLFIKGLMQGGINGGLSEEQSKALAIQTFIGAAKLAKESEYDLSTLIDRVCSKGGTTIEAINVYKNNGIEEIIEKGVEACRIRSEELSKLL